MFGSGQRKTARQEKPRALAHRSHVPVSYLGCPLSRHRDCSQMLDTIRRTIYGQRLTVLVTHWWEYFPNRRPGEAFIKVLHETADLLANDPEIRVVSFEDLSPQELR